MKLQLSPLIRGDVASFIQAEVMRRLKPLSPVIALETQWKDRQNNEGYWWERIPEQFAVEESVVLAQLREWGTFWTTYESGGSPNIRVQAWMASLDESQGPAAEADDYPGYFLPLDFRGPMLVTSGEYYGCWLIPLTEEPPPLPL